MSDLTDKQNVAHCVSWYVSKCCLKKGSVVAMAKCNANLFRSTILCRLKPHKKLISTYFSKFSQFHPQNTSK